MGPPWLGDEKIFHNRSSQRAGKCYVEHGFYEYRAMLLIF